MLQCVAVCCSVLHSVLQCVLQRVLQCVLQCAATCVRPLQQQAPAEARLNKIQLFTESVAALIESVAAIYRVSCSVLQCVLQCAAECVRLLQQQAPAAARLNKNQPFTESVAAIYRVSCSHI